MLSTVQVDEAFNVLGLSPPTPALLSTLESIPDEIQAFADIVALPEAQTVDLPIMQMLSLVTGHYPASETLTSIATSALTEPELAAAIVGSQTFASNYNGGALTNPNAPASADFVDAMFLNGLGHPPTVATEAGFAGLSNAQAFLEFSMSPTMIAAHANDVTATLMLIVEQATGVPVVGGSGPNTV